MLPKIKNAIIFISIAAVLGLAYVFLIKESPSDTLVSYPQADGTAADATAPALDQDFLPLLLSVKSIRLDDSIFSDPAFMNLVDGSILLVPDNNEGRPNPFAPLGADAVTVVAKPNQQ